MHALVATSEDKLLGLAHFFRHPHNWKAEEVTYLQDLFVDSAARGKRVGEALIQGVYTEADRAGAPSVYWSTQEFNHTARKLYDRVGEKTPFIKYQRPAK
eukprot:TRINITY_DN654_c0_g1_i3.p1 TRINITY_DN654_c0_g1~~TRINITY_DN654_c0_g1_i3.p1  ORF type:complete len:100 (-),score=20.70 TRINITY_DN654_c0_g1_i3:296-595(-)